MGPYPMPRAAGLQFLGDGAQAREDVPDEEGQRVRTSPETTSVADSPYTGRRSENMARDGMV